jgi:hypothetical protein
MRPETALPARLQAARRDRHAHGRAPTAEAGAIPVAFHLLMGLLAATGVTFALATPESGLLVGEDRLVEWWTVALYAAAGGTLVSRGVRARRLFDVLVGLFCLFVAGEEFSWGQRLLGYQPPAFFLQHNLQQEANLHNMVSDREILSYAVAGYGLLLPLALRFPLGRRVAAAVGATAPAAALAAWFALAIVMVQWDPTRISGEFAECMTGALFVASTWHAGARRRWVAPTAALGAALLLTAASERRGDLDDVACARAEVDALLADLTVGRAATPQVVARGTPSKRVWSAVGDGDVDWTRATRFAAVACRGAAAEGSAERRRFAVDPWGIGYYVAVERTPGGEVVALVHSFGPNHGRDNRADPTAGDDIARRAAIGGGR